MLDRSVFPNGSRLAGQVFTGWLQFCQYFERSSQRKIRHKNTAVGKSFCSLSIAQSVVSRAGVQISKSADQSISLEEVLTMINREI